MSSVDLDILLSLISFQELSLEVASIETLSKDILKTWLESKQGVSLDKVSLSDLDML